MSFLRDNPEAAAQLAKNGTSDLSYSIPGRSRFRVNIFQQRGSLQDLDSVILKMIERDQITLEDWLSFSTNQNNLLLQLNGMGGSADSAAASKASVKTALPVAPPMAKNPNSLLDMIE